MTRKLRLKQLAGFSVLFILSALLILRSDREFQAVATIRLHPSMHWFKRMGREVPPTSLESQENIIRSNETIEAVVNSTGLKSRWNVSKDEACEAILDGLALEEGPLPDQFLVSYSYPDQHFAEKILAAVMASYQEQRRVLAMIRGERALGFLEDRLREQSKLVERAAKQKEEAETATSKRVGLRVAQLEYLREKEKLAKMQSTYATNSTELALPDTPISIEMRSGQWRQRISLSVWVLLTAAVCCAVVGMLRQPFIVRIPKSP